MFFNPKMKLTPELRLKVGFMQNIYAEIKMLLCALALLVLLVGCTPFY